MSYTVEQLSIGQTASLSKTVSESDIYMFAGITGDVNPVHVNEPYASRTFFKGRIAHGLLSAGFISAVMAMYLPGPGAIYLEQSLQFLAPVRIGDTVTATATVEEVDSKRNIAVLRTVCSNQNNEVVIDGKAKVKPPLPVSRK